VLAGIVGALLLSVFVFMVLTFSYFTLHSPTGLPVRGAAIGAGVGFVAGFIGGDPMIRALARLLGWSGSAV